MSSESELNIDDLHKLRDLYEALDAAEKEFQATYERMTEHDSYFASDAIQSARHAIERHEADYPKVAAAYHAE